MIASCIVTCNCHWNYTNNVCDIVVFDGSRSAPTFTSVNYHYKLTAVKANSSPCMQHDFTIFKNILVQALGMFSTVVFFVPVTSSTNTREKIINRSRTEMSQPAVPAATDSETTSATLTTVQQPISDHPSDTGADSDPPAYSSIIGEGDTSQNARSGGVEEPYYMLRLNRALILLLQLLVKLILLTMLMIARRYRRLLVVAWRMVPIILGLCIWNVGLLSLQLQMTKPDMMSHLVMNPSLHDFYIADYSTQSITISDGNDCVLVCDDSAE